MFLIDILSLMFQLEFIKYLYISFAFFGVMLLLRKVIFHKGV